MSGQRTIAIGDMSTTSKGDAYLKEMAEALSPESLANEDGSDE